MVHLNPKSGRWDPDLSHNQRHVNAAIFYNIWEYYRATADIDFLWEHGAEMMLEIARFWSSIAHYNEERDRYDRLLAYVHRADDGLFVNEALVAGGWAAPYRFPPNVRYADRFSDLGAQARAQGVAPEEFRSRIVANSAKATPLGRVAEAEDGANLVAFLASEDASFITGQAYNVNGGTLFH